MTKPAPEIEALAETLAEVRGELAEFRRERDALSAANGLGPSGVYGGHLRMAAELAARLSNRGWRLVPAIEKQPA